MRKTLFLQPQPEPNPAPLQARLKRSQLPA
jgi:hypothetical protein